MEPPGSSRDGDAQSPAAIRFRLRLLGAFELRDRAGLRVDLPPAGQRLVAWTALVDGRRATRWRASSTLWPGVDDVRARANLRNALWRVRSVCDAVLEVRDDEIGLGPVSVDLDRPPDVLGHDEAVELLPDWGDDWLVAVRERVRLDRLRALEDGARGHLATGDWALAIDTALRAVAIEPLRESAHCLAITAHLRMGNRVDGLRQLRRCMRVLDEELGVPPSADLRALAHRVTSGGRDVPVTPPGDSGVRQEVLV